MGVEIGAKTPEIEQGFLKGLSDEEYVEFMSDLMADLIQAGSEI